MTKKEVTILSTEIFTKVSEDYGDSKFHHHKPYLLVEDSPYSDEEDPDIFGEYCATENELTIYWKNIETQEDLIRTMIHEYQHYLFSPSWFTRYYKMGHWYNTHPHEIKAREEEEKWINYQN